MLNALAGSYHLPAASNASGVVVVVVVVVAVVVDVDVEVEVVLGVVVVVLDVVVVVAGAGLVTTGVCGDVATAVPFLLLAVTVTRNVEAKSAETSRYVCSVAEAIGEHAVPSGAQRDH